MSKSLASVSARRTKARASTASRACHPSGHPDRKPAGRAAAPPLISLIEPHPPFNDILRNVVHRAPARERRGAQPGERVGRWCHPAARRSSRSPDGSRSGPCRRLQQLRQTPAPRRVLLVQHRITGDVRRNQGIRQMFAHSASPACHGTGRTCRYRPVPRSAARRTRRARRPPGPPPRTPASGSRPRRQVRQQHRNPGGVGLQARALTQLHLQPGDRAGVPPGTGQHARRLRPRHQHQRAPGQGHLIHGEPAEPLYQLARTGRSVLFGDRRHDAGPPSVVPHVASSPAMPQPRGAFPHRTPPPNFNPAQTRRHKGPGSARRPP